MTTKGEVLISGLDQIREGLDMISQLGNGNDLVKNLIGSQAAANRLKNVLADKSLVYNLVLSMVRSRNSRLTDETVSKIVNDFLDVLFDLSKPYRDVEAESENQVEGQACKTHYGI